MSEIPDENSGETISLSPATMGSLDSMARDLSCKRDEVVALALAVLHGLHDHLLSGGAVILRPSDDQQPEQQLEVFAYVIKGVERYLEEQDS